MEPNHSESFLYRTNNPQGLHKSEADHIAFDEKWYNDL